MTKLRLVRVVTTTVAVTLGAALWASPAGAESSSVTADIAAGSKGTVIGTATFTRTVDADGSETLTVHLEVPDGIEESSICLSSEPFTTRVPPGRCAYHQGATGTTADYTIDLGTEYAAGDDDDGELYAQVHAVSGDETAYAGWQAGRPFYGNVGVPAPAGSTTVPVTALGAVGLAVCAAVVLAVGLRRTRRSTAST